MFTPRPLWASGAVGLALLGLATACAPTPAAPPAAAPAAPGAPPAVAPGPAASAAKPGGALRVGTHRDVSDLDPHTTQVPPDIWIMQHVYSTLVRAGEDLVPKSDLATQWDFKGQTTLEFTLRQGAKFQNGREVIAEDVKYSLQRILDPNTVSSWSSTIASIASIEAPDRYRVVLTLKQPDAAILNNLTVPVMAVVAKEAVEPMPVGLKRTMVGSGPFKFKEQVPDQRLVLVKHPDYFVPGQPLLDEVQFLPLPDDTARTSALRAGQIDHVALVPPKDLGALRADRNFVVAGGPSINFVSISLNTTKKPYDDVRVRQALAYAIDRKEAGEKAFDGVARPLWGPPLTPPYWAGNPDQYYTYDPERARRLLSEAGYPNGFATTINIGAHAYHRPLSQVVQSELKKVGVVVEIRAFDAPTSTKAWREGDFEMFPIRWLGSDFIDPDGALRPLFTCSGSSNRSRFCNERVDELILKGLTVTAPEERKAIYREAMKALAEQAPWVFLLAPDQFQAMRSHVKGYTAFPNESLYSLREVWLDR